MKKFQTLLILLLFPIFMNAQEWQTDINDAQEIAKNDHKNIVLVFQGSDWCAPCIKLSKQVWETEEFKDYASENYVMLQADFPKKKEHRLPENQQAKNEKLAEKYNPNGYFPFVVVLDENGKVLGQTGYKNVSANEYIAILNKF